MLRQALTDVWGGGLQSECVLRGPWGPQSIRRSPSGQALDVGGIGVWRMRRSGVVGLVSAALFLALLPVARGAEDTAEDPLTGPFLCVLPSGLPRGARPEEFVRSSLASDAPGEALTTERLASGLVVARPLPPPLDPVLPEDHGVLHRQAVLPGIAILQAIPPSALGPMLQGRVTDLTSYREPLARAVPGAGEQPEPGTVGACILDCEHLVGVVALCPIIEYDPYPPEVRRSAMPMLRASLLALHAQHIDIRAVQFDDEGSVSWELGGATEAARTTAEPWLVITGQWTGAHAPAPDLHTALSEADAAAPISIVLDRLSGQTVGQVWQLLWDGVAAAGVALEPELAARQLYARGGGFSRADVLAALLAAIHGELCPPDADRTSWVLLDTLGRTGQGQALEAARLEADPELTQQVSEFFAPALRRRVATTLPAHVDRFASGWSGQWEHLEPDEGRGLAAILQRSFDGLARRGVPVPCPGPGAWFRLSMQYRVLIVPCRPWTGDPRGPANGTGKQPPASYFDRYGADRSRPLYEGTPFVVCFQ